MSEVYQLPDPRRGHHLRLARLRVLCDRYAFPGSPAGDDWDAWAAMRDSIDETYARQDNAVLDVPGMAENIRRLDAFLAKAEDYEGPVGPPLTVIEGGAA